MIETKELRKISSYMKIKAAAEYLGVSPNTLRNWEKREWIKVYRSPINKYRLYLEEDLKLLLLTLNEVANENNSN